MLKNLLNPKHSAGQNEQGQPVAQNQIYTDFKDVQHIIEEIKEEKIQSDSLEESKTSQPDIFHVQISPTDEEAQHQAQTSQTFIEFLIKMDQTQRRNLNFLTHLEKENYAGAQIRNNGQKGHSLVQQMRNSGSVSQYGQVLYIIKTYLAEGSYDTDNYLELNLDPVFFRGFNDPSIPEKDRQLKVLQYELSKIARPLNSS